MFNNWFGVAGDLGPSQLIDFFVANTSCKKILFNPSEIESVEFWTHYLKNNNAMGLICGTSQSIIGFKWESTLRKAANTLGLTVICMEDFPGNYNEIGTAKTDILIIEDEFSLRLYHYKLKEIPKSILCPSLRYDVLRCDVIEKPIFNSERLKVLWIGQPEFEFNIKSLLHIIAEIKNLSITLLFRAHPSDVEYKNGLYIKFFEDNNLTWQDVTLEKIDSNLFNNVSLLITQFSSVSILAGFYGVPSLHLLFKDVGEKLLLERTGSADLMQVFYNAAFYMKDHRKMNYLHSCIFDSAQREIILSNFAKLYKINQKQMPNLIYQIEKMLHFI